MVTRNNPRDELLITEVRRNECLFNTLIGSYRNRVARDDALATISRNMAESGYPMTGMK